MKFVVGSVFAGFLLLASFQAWDEQVYEVERLRDNQEILVHHINELYKILRSSR